jgi:hypothetical protein
MLAALTRMAVEISTLSLALGISLNLLQRVSSPARVVS